MGDSNWEKIERPDHRHFHNHMSLTLEGAHSLRGHWVLARGG